MARPTRSDALKKQFLQVYIPMMGNISAITSKLKMDRTTYYKWMREDPEFKEAVESLDITEIKLDLAEYSLNSLMKEKYWPAVKFYLEKHGEKRGYGESGKITIEADGKALQNIRPQIIFENTSNEELDVIDEDE